MDSTEASLDKAPFHCQGEGKRGRDIGVGDVPMCDLEEQDNDTVRKEQGRGASRVPAGNSSSLPSQHLWAWMTAHGRWSLSPALSTTGLKGVKGLCPPAAQRRPLPSVLHCLSSLGQTGSVPLPFLRAEERWSSSYSPQPTQSFHSLCGRHLESC